MKTTETKHSSYLTENVQLFHNVWDIKLNFLQTGQGLGDNDGDVPNAYPPNIRVGDAMYLRNISLRIWLSNKDDRANCIYRILMFSYPANDTPTSSDIVYEVGVGNNLLRRYNTDKISILKTHTTKIIRPNDTLDEQSKLITMNFACGNRWKVQYEKGQSVPKGKNVGFAVLCYDAYGTLQTDNIASYGFDMKLSWKDP